jgi:hypothetical protein
MSTESDEQAERRATLLQDVDLRRRQEREQRERGSTYLDHHQSELGGRFGSIETETITGKPSPQPPPLPANSPRAGPDIVPPEPPTGFEIDAMTLLEPSAVAVEATDPASADAPSSVSPLAHEQRADAGPFSSEKGDDAA